MSLEIVGLLATRELSVLLALGSPGTDPSWTTPCGSLLSTGLSESPKAAFSSSGSFESAVLCSGPTSFLPTGVLCLTFRPRNLAFFGGSGVSSPSPELALLDTPQQFRKPRNRDTPALVCFAGFSVSNCPPFPDCSTPPESAF